MTLPKFKVGERVQVAHILDGITSRELLGKVGTVEEIESLPELLPLLSPYMPLVVNPEPTQHNYEVRLDYSGHQHYLNEQMLEPA